MFRSHIRDAAFVFALVLAALASSLEVIDDQRGPGSPLVATVPPALGFIVIGHPLR